MTNNTSPPGWYQDPTGQGDGRYWNGSSWTEAVDRGGMTVNVPIDPNQALTPPLPGTQVSIPASPAAVPAATRQPAGGASTSSRSPIGAIIGLLVVIVIAVVIIVIVTNDSSESPTPGTDTPPATEAPATDPPADGG